MAQDILLKYHQKEGFFDIETGETDLSTVDGLETTVVVLLFTDARAAPEEVRAVDKRRGWVGNILRSRELGGMLWLVSQAKNTREIRNRIINWAENSLQPLVDENLATSVVATADVQGVRGILLSIRIEVIEGETRDFEFWLNTDLGNITDVN